MDFPIILFYPQLRANLHPPKAKWNSLGGLAFDDGKGTIGLGWFKMGKDDYTSCFSITELLTHETLHHLVRQFEGNRACQQLDVMIMWRGMMDSWRKYINIRKLDLVVKEVPLNRFDVSISSLFMEKQT